LRKLFTACLRFFVGQSPENGARLVEAFERLVVDLDASLDICSRDRFAQRLAAFRQRVRVFLTV